MIEIKKRLIDRKWGWLVVYDIYSDGVLVAIKNGGHYDLTAKDTHSRGIDMDGDTYIITHENRSHTLPFEMTAEIQALCEAKEPLKAWMVFSLGNKAKGPFLTQAEAYAAKESRWDKVEKIIYSIE